MWWNMYSENIKKPMASIQLAKASEARGLEIGETMTITVTGKVVSVEAPHEGFDYGPTGSKSKMVPGCISVEIESISVSQKDDV
jgi:hypothetical protein